MFNLLFYLVNKNSLSGTVYFIFFSNSTKYGSVSYSFISISLFLILEKNLNNV